MSEKKLSPIAIQALKDALSSIYWYKNDLRSFLENCLTNKELIYKQDWDNYKRQIVSDIIDGLISNQSKYLSELTKLCFEVAKMESFHHLRELDDGTKKAERAKNAVEALKKLINPHKDLIQDEKNIEERRKSAKQKLERNKAVREKLDQINQNYLKLLTDDPQKRGYDLEKIMYDLFELFDLDPKASFKILGEQIDGSFNLDGTDYIFEARWRNEPTDREALDTFTSKVKRKLENTLGLFLSINNYEPSAVTLHSERGACIILMTGADLMAVLEGRIDLPTLLIRKKKHASQTGNILLNIHEIF
ncbi:MAG: hypothetical protein IH886_13145 [Nitrospinae bacterium]|nr:hypothetical protein [Nitrospinota bacterium]